ncbi:hypothetical protein VNO77_11342 [Canavalia gladiata]|uniref:Uncharacterized protein n=1 Tax=Canavalia gladiata TaxID=3824 RepID=A0AAN9MBD6_CANGL
MPRKKQQCGFRIPWISGPSTESQSRPPKQKQKSKSAASNVPIHRPPFRPPGIASAPSQPKVKELELELHSAATENSNSNSNSNQSRCKGNDIKHGQSIPRRKAEVDTTALVERKMMFATSNPSSGNNVSTIPLSNDQNVSTEDISTLAVDDKTVSVVTLAGDNRGVTMHVAGSRSSTKTPERKEKKEEAGKAYVNSNIQSINNSIMSHGSIHGRDPGVRVVLPQYPDKQPCVENPKAQVSINRVESLPYRPVVRRRCLRGLFLEPSDSDPDDPNKPRSHGCKVSCSQITKDKDTLTK